MELSLNSIITALGKQNASANDVIIKEVSTDSRKITQGCLFVALVGDIFNGHDFVDKALERGAVMAVVSNPDYAGKKTILVPDTKLALLKIAGLHRSNLTTKIVGVTGSVGKTTTKELIALVLSTSGKTFKTKANLNNEIGLSQMLLQLDNSYDYAVLELGVDGIDQMAPMSYAAAVDVAVVTNIGESHIMEFKTRSNIKKEKLDIRLGLKEQSRLILNGDDNLLAGERGLHYSIDNANADIYADDIVIENFSSSFNVYYKNKSYCAELSAMGSHNVLNALAAVLTGVELGIGVNSCIKALTEYKPEGMRQNVVKVKDFTIVEDNYNASPKSVKAAIETLSQMQATGRKILVLSDMLELGEEEKQYHADIGKVVATNNIDILYTTGILSKEIYRFAKENGLDQAFYYSSKDELAQALNKELKNGDIVWFKASRGMRLEEVIAQIH